MKERIEKVPTIAFGIDIQNYGDESEMIFMIDLEDLDIAGSNDEALITRKLGKGPFKIKSIVLGDHEKIVTLES